jgi:hypothetical protein
MGLFVYKSGVKNAWVFTSPDCQIISASRSTRTELYRKAMSGHEWPMDINKSLGQRPQGPTQASKPTHPCPHPLLSHKFQHKLRTPEDSKACAGTSAGRGAGTDWLIYLLL